MVVDHSAGCGRTENEIEQRLDDETEARIHGGLDGRQGRRIILLVGPSNIRFFLYNSIVRAQQETRHPVHHPKPQSQRFLTPTTLISTLFQGLYVSGATLRVTSHSPSPPNTPHASVSQVPVTLAP